jgi:hypothetical protein
MRRASFAANFARSRGSLGEACPQATKRTAEIVLQHGWQLWDGDEVPQAIRKRWMPQHFFVRIAAAAKEIPMRTFNSTQAEGRVKGVRLANSRNAFSIEQTGGKSRSGLAIPLIKWVIDHPLLSQSPQPCRRIIDPKRNRVSHANPAFCYGESQNRRSGKTRESTLLSRGITFEP